MLPLLRQPNRSIFSRHNNAMTHRFGNRDFLLTFFVVVGLGVLPSTGSTQEQRLAGTLDNDGSSAVVARSCVAYSPVAQCLARRAGRRNDRLLRQRRQVEDQTFWLARVVGIEERLGRPIAFCLQTGGLNQ